MEDGSWSGEEKMGIDCLICVGKTDRLENFRWWKVHLIKLREIFILWAIEHLSEILSEKHWNLDSV